MRRLEGSLEPASDVSASTDGEVVGTIVCLRQNYHFGPAKISMYLARYHDVAVSRSGCGASSSVST